MRERSLWLAAALTLSWVSAGVLEALPREREKWIRVDTDHFTLISNSTERDTLRLGDQVERLRQVLETIATDMRVQSAVPTKIFVFRSEASFRPYKLAADGRPLNVSGYFAGVNDGNFVALDASAGNESFRVIFHEYVHQWLQTNVPGIPLWLDEGLAEFYSTFRSGEQDAEIGRHIDSHVFWLRDNRLITLDELFEMTRSSPEYHEGNRQGTIYAESWALVHFLMTSRPESRSKVSEYAFQVSNGSDPKVAFEKTFALTLAAAQNELQGYVRQAAFNFYRYQFGITLGAGGALVRELPREQVLAELGELLVRTGGPEHAAQEHLQAALAIDPELADAWSTLGLLDGLRGEHVAAEAALRKAVELEPENPRCRWLYGQALFDRFKLESEGGADISDEARGLLRSARAEFESALAVDPKSVPAMIGYGMTWVYDSEPATGVDALERAWRSVPQRPDVLVALISAHAVAGQSAEARRLLERSLRAHGNDEMTRAAETAVAYSELNQAIDLFYSGEPDAAFGVLEASLQVTREADLHAMLIDRRQQLRQELKRQSDVDAFNEAVALARSGDLAASRQSLEELLALPLHDELQEPARRLLLEVIGEAERVGWIAEFNRGVRAAQEGEMVVAREIFLEVLGQSLDEDFRGHVEKALAQVEASLE